MVTKTILDYITSTILGWKTPLAHFDPFPCDLYLLSKQSMLTAGKLCYTGGRLE